MTSNFAKYLKERENKEILEDSRGFATYIFQDDFVYIEDIYVVPEKRKEGVASEYADSICRKAKALGYQKAMGTVSTLANGATENVKILLSYGFNITSADNNIIYFMKEI